ncbi:MAG TPA: hypothetical protein VM409_06200 [Chloroflexia bacterium]|nr:hypothetical protein [Chloroflexia bacterium]
MADELYKLLRYIVQHNVIQNESREAQLDATAVQDVSREVKSIAAGLEGDALHRAPYFAQGLRMAAAAQGPIVVDDTDAAGNAIAEAFARYLVAPDLAASQSTAIGEAQYRYTFDVNWPRLRELSHRAGVDLEAALKNHP